jgi:hypothetical protein
MFKFHFNWRSAADFTRTVIGAGTAVGVLALNSDQASAIVGVVGSVVVLVTTFLRPSSSV